MSFLNPFFLFAVAAVGLPLLIHLLNLRRPQRLAFSTLAFFKELQKTTIRRIRIKRYLLLVLRLLAIACLALVLARPFLPPGLSGSSSQAPALNAILLDNSISMNRIGQEGPLLEQAKEIIRLIEEASKENDRFIFQVSNGQAQFVNIIGHSQLLRRVEQVDARASGNYLADRVQELVQILEEAPYTNKRLFIITDGQLSQLEGLKEVAEIPKTISTTVFDLGEVDIQNTVITGIQTNTTMIGAGLPVRIMVDIQNQANIPISNQFLTLEFEGEIAGQYSVSLEAGASATFEFEVIPQKKGSSIGKVVLEGDEFADDNTYFFSIQVPGTRQVLWVNEAEVSINQVQYTEVVLQASGQNDAQLQYQKAKLEQLESLNLANFEAIILDGLDRIPEYTFPRFQEFVQQGGGVLFFPSERGDISNYNQFIRLFNVGTFEGINGEYASFRPIAAATKILDDHPVFEELFERMQDEDLRVDYPEVFYYLKLRPSTSPGGFSIFQLNTNDPFVREKRFGEGKILVSAIGTDPGWSNFPINPLFAPFYYRALLYVASSDQGGLEEHILGTPFTWTGALNNAKASIIVEGSETIPESEITGSGTKITFPAENWNPGWITITDGEKEYSIAVNMNRRESEFVTATESDFAGIAETFTLVNTSELPEQNLQTEIISSGFGREIWNWFMWAGLFFLLLETVVSLVYKTETVQT